MIRRLHHYFAPPIFKDEEKTRAAAVLNGLQLALLGMLIISSIAIAFIFTRKTGSLLVAVGLTGVIATSRWLMFRGRIRVASLMIVWGIWVMVTLLMILAGGIKGVDAVYYISLTVIAGLLLGPQAISTVAVISGLTSLGMAIYEGIGYTLPQVFPIAPYTNWVKFILGLSMVAITLNVALQRLREALTLAQQQLVQRQKAEAALYNSEARLRAILNAAIDVSFVVTDADDVEPRVLEFSPGAERIFGYRRDEIIGEPVAKLHLPEDVAQFPTITQQMREGKKGFEGETRLIKRSGASFPALFSTYPLFDADGAMRSALGIGIDITQRRQTIDALRKSEEKFRQIVEASPMGIHLYEVDTEDHIIFTGNNRAADRILGVSNDQFIGKTIDEAFPPLAQTEVPYHYRRAALEGIPWHTQQIDYAHDTIKGAYEVHAFQTGERRVTVMFSDITERKRAEQERERLLSRIQEQAQQVHQIIDTVPEGVLLLDAAGCVILANPRGEQDLDVLAQASVGDRICDLGGYVLESLLQPPPGGLWHEVEMDKRYYQIIARSMEPGQEDKGWLLVIRDVTQQRDVEQRAQQQERLAAVGQLAAGIAHDFNNIMATIVLYTQMSAWAEDLSLHIKERLNIIQQQAMHAARLTQQILDFSRRAILEREPLDLLALIQTQIEILQRTLPENIVISITHAPGDYIIDGSSTYMQQVFLNLAVNARDAMPDGGILHFALNRLVVDQLGTGPLPEMAPGRWLELRVADTGHGIAPDVLPHIFEPFFTTKEPGQGTGLGLAQVHGIVGMHGGYTDVETLLGSGTTFILYMPTLETPQTAPALRGPSDDLVVGEGQTILVVEDNAITQTALAESVEALNYRVRVAHDGQQALALLEQSPDEIDLVLSDVVMPEMGGIGLLRAMQRRNINVRVVLLTGHPLQEELEQMQTQRASSLLAGWILKPPNLETMAQVIGQALETKYGPGKVEK